MVATGFGGELPVEIGEGDTTFTLHGRHKGLAGPLAPIQDSNGNDITAICSVNLVDTDPWWQVIGGSVISGRDIISSIPINLVKYLIEDGIAGSVPGIAYFGSSSDIKPDPKAAPSKVSTTNWNASTNMTAFSGYTYDHFRKLIPSSITLEPLDSIVGQDDLANCNHASGYCWYEAVGSIEELQKQSLTNKKVVMFVNGDLNITGPISFDHGTGFFMAIVAGNINIDGVSVPTGPELEGIYFTDHDFTTDTGNTDFKVRGVVVSKGNISLNRNLEAGNFDDPSEIFEFAPDVILNYPRLLINRNFRWIGEVDQ